MIEFGIIYSIDIDVVRNIISAKLDETKVVEIHKKTYLDENTNIISIEVNEIMTEKN
jgi:hypothetical protein